MSNKIYDKLKFFCLTVSPALIVMVNVIMPTLGMDAKVTTTIISAVTTFIGTVIGISSLQYASEINSEVENQPVEEVLEVLQSDAVSFHGESIKLTGNALQIIKQYTWVDYDYEYVENLYGDGSTKIYKSKKLTDEEREAKYEKMVCKYPEKYTVNWAYDTSLTLNENLYIAQGLTTKEQLCNKNE